MYTLSHKAEESGLAKRGRANEARESERDGLVEGEPRKGLNYETRTKWHIGARRRRRTFVPRAVPYVFCNRPTPPILGPKIV